METIAEMLDVLRARIRGLRCQASLWERIARDRDKKLKRIMGGCVSCGADQAEIAEAKTTILKKISAWEIAKASRMRQKKRADTYRAALEEILDIVARVDIDRLGHIESIAREVLKADQTEGE